MTITLENTIHSESCKYVQTEIENITFLLFHMFFKILSSSLFFLIHYLDVCHHCLEKLILVIKAT